MALPAKTALPRSLERLESDQEQHPRHGAQHRPEPQASRAESRDLALVPRRASPSRARLQPEPLQRQKNPRREMHSTSSTRAGAQEHDRFYVGRATTQSLREPARKSQL